MVEDDDEDGESVDDLLVAAQAAQGTLGWTAGPSEGPGAAAAAILAEKPPAEEAAVLRAMLEGPENGAGAGDGGESSDWETSSDEGGEKAALQQAALHGDGIQDRRARRTRVPAPLSRPGSPVWDLTNTCRATPPLCSSAPPPPQRRRAPRAHAPGPAAARRRAPPASLSAPPPAPPQSSQRPDEQSHDFLFPTPGGRSRGPSGVRPRGVHRGARRVRHVRRRPPPRRAGAGPRRPPPLRLPSPQGALRRRPPAKR